MKGIINHAKRIHILNVTISKYKVQVSTAGRDQPF